MVVKSRIGRRRYIIVQNSSALREILPELRDIDSWVRIVSYCDNFAIVRCRHWHKEQIIQTLNNFGIKTYRTTGTIKKAKKIIKGLTP